MKLEDQVCSLELAKKLRELGAKQESYLGYKERTGYKANRCSGKNHPKNQHPKTYSLLVKEFSERNNEKGEMYSAFTIAELGEMIPKGYYTKQTQDGWRNYLEAKQVKNKQDAWERSLQAESNEVDARAKMLIYLFEKKIISTP